MRNAKTVAYGQYVTDMPAAVVYALRNEYVVECVQQVVGFLFDTTCSRIVLSFID